MSDSLKGKVTEITGGTNTEVLEALRQQIKGSIAGVMPNENWGEAQKEAFEEIKRLLAEHFDGGLLCLAALTGKGENELEGYTSAISFGAVEPIMDNLASWTLMPQIQPFFFPKVDKKLMLQNFQKEQESREMQDSGFIKACKF